jgi:hypothetical protein
MHGAVGGEFRVLPGARRVPEAISLDHREDAIVAIDSRDAGAAK